MERVVTLTEFVRSLESKLKKYGSCTVECVYINTGESGVTYYTFDLLDKNGKLRRINVKALRG